MQFEYAIDEELLKFTSPRVVDEIRSTFGLSVFNQLASCPKSKTFFFAEPSGLAWLRANLCGHQSWFASDLALTSKIFMHDFFFAQSCLKYGYQLTEEEEATKKIIFAGQCTSCPHPELIYSGVISDKTAAGKIAASYGCYDDLFLVTQRDLECSCPHRLWVHISDLETRIIGEAKISADVEAKPDQAALRSFKSFIEKIEPTASWPSDLLCIDMCLDKEEKPKVLSISPISSSTMYNADIVNLTREIDAIFTSITSKSRL